MDPLDPEHFDGLEEKFDTALVVNVLDRVVDDQTLLKNVWSTLQPGGRALVFVAQNPNVFGELDKALGRRERYTRAKLEKTLMAAGFEVEDLFDFNRFSVPGWWLNGKLLRKNRISRLQLKVVDILMPLLSRIDRLYPWKGLSLVGIAKKVQA
jgi:SAM-dependent methyltransferase